ncbi:hypothetical protein EYF80_038437 [Liparis tanakae]|uniref:Uncharacterized protein n=1 Tax=Liparis tanakae TaxID=230148 RepID=A0A4Z2GDA6_9TELE|nr:hypothetical protein EYF80_038437 [Liparis tanakae]
MSRSQCGGIKCLEFCPVGTEEAMLKPELMTLQLSLKGRAAPRKHFEDKGDHSARDPCRSLVAVTPHPAPSVMKRRHGLVTA